MTSRFGPEGWRYLPTDDTVRETAAIDTSLARFQCAIESVNGQSIPAALLAEALALIRSLADESLAIRQRYDSLFDAVPDPVVVLDEHGILLDLNRAALASYRQPRESLIGVSIRQINPSLPANHLDLVWESLERGGTHVEQTSNRRADGSEFPVEVHSASFDDHGKRRIVAVARDLTGRDRAERRYRQLLDTIDKGVLVQDTRGRPLSGNAAAYRILNIPTGWFPGRADLRDWRLLDPEGRRIRLRDLPALRALRERRTIESTLVGVYRRGEGDLRWISVTAVPQFERERRDPTQVISLFSDVTELRRDYGLFQRAQSLARIGGWQWDRWRDQWYFTSQALNLLGRVGEHGKGGDFAVDSESKLLELIHPDDRLTLEASLHRVANDGDPIRIDFRLSGEPTVWLRLTGEPEGSGPLAARIVGTIQDISESKQAESELRIRAQSDNLTGLLNREGIQAELEARLRRAQPTGIALLYIDLDRFKIVNDLLGHAVGDEVLIGVARRMRRAVGNDGILARFGGDEFMVLVDAPHDPELPVRLAQRIATDFGDRFSYGNEEFSITTSIGVAIHPQDGANAQQLINNADAAMYDAKRRGRSTWQSFNPTLSRRQQDRLRIETHLHRALESNEFQLVYQPQVDLASGRVVGAEALIRWHSRALGEIAPDRFIEHAETTGDIVRIGEWVLREACIQLQAWRSAGLELPRISVNVSYRQFLNENFSTMVGALLADHGLNGADLEVEFTERVLIEDISDTMNTFNTLRDMGVKLTIDDFGEGYSALNYLRRLPIDSVKISKSFLQGVPDESSDVAICRAITGVARNLGLQVIAEGVENQAQRRFLLQNGIRIGQGFLFAPGMPATDFAARLVEQSTP